MPFGTAERLTFFLIRSSLHYRRSREIKTITDLYREWYDGLAGGYLVETLERQWGVKWREDQEERKNFNKRRSIITTINSFAQQHNITIETAANVTEERRSPPNKSLHYLAEHNDQIFE
ncbi:hypothetical protein [Absidia glauca]|uniref:Transcription activator GCR1-like domain-containing protein n=1 Tax=Absidia glauca TaxID=4829 RepID=A0A163K0E0_ABSGL|nr:hypothetical protein [Absidia glauca]